MKLESLNNEKFKSNTNEMGSLVGGLIRITDTNGGGLYDYKSTSADRNIAYTGTDVQNGIYNEYYQLSGADDMTRRDAIKPHQQK